MYGDAVADAAYLWESHDLSKRSEDKDALAKQLICHAVHKLTSIQASQEVLLPLTD